MRKIILASASERRADIFRLSGIPFDVDVSDYREDLTLPVSPRELAETLALGKALSVVPRHSDAIIIAADTFIVVDGAILGKPLTEARAKEMLRTLSGRSHLVLTGYAIIDTRDGRQDMGVEETKVFFRELQEKEIEAYVRHGHPSPLDLAGAYAIQAGGALFVTKIEGDYYNVVGLPLLVIVEKLSRFGVIE